MNTFVLSPLSYSMESRRESRISDKNNKKIINHEMTRKDLLNLANALLNQNGYDENGSKITNFSKNQNLFEKRMIAIPF